MANIAIVNNFFPPRTGGSAHMAQAEAEAMAARGHRVLVVTAAYKDAPREEEVDGYRVVRLPSWHLPKMKLAFNFDISFVTSPRSVRRLFRLLDDFAPDVIHQHGQFFDLTFLSSIFARRRRVPTLLSVHTRLESPSRLQNAIFALGDRTLVRSFIAISRPHVVVMDRLMQRYIHRRYRVPEERQVPIPVGVDPARFTAPSQRDVRNELSIGDGPLILSIGHVIPVRDRMTLVRGFALLHHRYPDARLLVVGGVYDDRFLEEADRLGVADAVITTGAVPKDEIVDYVAAADIESHDLDGYGLGTAGLEVMAAGLPTVVGVAADNFVDSELSNWSNVVLIPPSDHAALAEAMERLLKEPEIAARVARGQQELIRERFTMSRVMDLHEAALLELAGSQPE